MLENSDIPQQISSAQEMELGTGEGVNVEPAEDDTKQESKGDNLQAQNLKACYREGNTALARQARSRYSIVLWSRIAVLILTRSGELRSLRARAAQMEFANRSIEKLIPPDKCTRLHPIKNVRQIETPLRSIPRN